VANVHSDFATLIRTAIILVVTFALVRYQGVWSNPFALAPRTLWFLLASALATGASWVCYFRALKVGEASRVAPVDKLSVVMVALFAAAFLGERPLPMQWLGIGLIAAGVALVAMR
jgi:transporter family protein